METKRKRAKPEYQRLPKLPVPIENGMWFKIKGDDKIYIKVGPKICKVLQFESTYIERLNYKDIEMVFNRCGELLYLVKDGKVIQQPTICQKK